jgi:ribosome biogenesis protein ERB1
MAPLAANRKRKQIINGQSDASDAEQHFPDGVLDLPSGDEDDSEDGPVQVSDSDGDVDAFPEIDTGSDTDEDGEASPGDDSESDDGGHDDDDASSDDSLRIFPKAKTIISDITGQPKKVYPEIEPDYDSDSSVEDVRASPMSLYSN